MAKRFTDTDKWKKPFIRSMKAPYKLLWLYILDECDHAGLWQVDFEVAQIKIGERLNRETALKFFEGRILEVSDGGKWFVFDFIEFQYGDLNPLNRAHNSVLNLLKKYGIDYKNKPLISPLQGAKDMDMVKDKDMDKDKGLSFPNFSERFFTAWELLLTQKKWKGKSKAALQASLNKLMPFEENTAIQMIENTIAGEWQGIFELKNTTKKEEGKLKTFLQTVEKARQA